MIESFKTGLWLTPARLKTYPIILLSMFCVAILLLIATGHGNFDRAGRPLGPDFTEIWAAGQDVLENHPASAYDAEAHRLKQAELFGPTPDFYLWSYPPYFLGVAAFFALFPYLIALFIWQAATLPLYLAAVWTILKRARLPVRTALISALAFPAVFVNLTHGQNGFLTTALLAGGVLNLKTRPLLAGALFACLAYKPQFTVMIPIALIAGGYWRSIFAGSLTLCGLTLITTAAFGFEIWGQFLQGIALAKSYVLDQGGASFGKMQSAFAAARLLGASPKEAYVVQAIIIGLAISGLAWLWHAPADDRLKGAALLTATLLATPYCFDYDLVLLGPALALAVSYGFEKGFLPYEKTLLASVWIAPLIGRPLAMAAGIPIAAPLMILLFVGILLRAHHDLTEPGTESHRQDTTREPVFYG